MYFLDQLLNGLSLGCIYAFIALGYTMVYGIIKLINFAHGEFFMVGAFAGYFVLMYAGIERLPLPYPLGTLMAFLVAVLAAALASAILAVVTERLAYRPLQGADRIAALLTALGVSLLLQNLGIQVFTAEQKGYPEPRRFITFEQAEEFSGEAFEGPVYVLHDVTSVLGDVSENRQVLVNPDQPFDPKVLTEYRDPDIYTWHGEPLEGFFVEQPIPVFTKKMIIIFALVISFALLWLLVHKTQVGRAMRAVSYNPEAAQLMGIASGRVISATFFIGAFLAGVGGVIWGMRYGKVEPFMGFLPGLKAFIAAVVGGIGSLPGAVVGGLALGLLEALVQGYLPSEYTGYRDAVAFVALIVILMVKPSGLLGREEGEKV
ncbi:MAG: branched-chain amino acid ABC transporter permease [Myxococcales bacterium]|nr:branched-chain amino acid ABC transporter permease [Myxococcales bacterium]